MHMASLFHFSIEYAVYILDVYVLVSVLYSGAIDV